jgi:hypothetical protein
VSGAARFALTLGLSTLGALIVYGLVTGSPWIAFDRLWQEPEDDPRDWDHSPKACNCASCRYRRSRERVDA